jgi:hypothetical protein
VTVGRVLAAISRHPVRFLAARWNWKAAALSACMRGPIFFAATLDRGLATAARTLLVDAAFRIPMAGVCAAVIQSVRWARPSWAAVAVAVLAVPAAAHAVEIAVHSIAMTPWLWRGVGASIALSIVSSAVQLVLMRRHILLVGPEAGSLGGDVRRLVRELGSSSV